MDARKSLAKKVSNRLHKWAPEAGCSLSHHNPLELLVATVLSAQCTDERVNIVTKTLFKKYRKAADYRDVPIGELEKDIYSTGFYRAKAKNIQGACKILCEKYAGKVPGELEKLIELPGVGRKTANVVLGNAFGIIDGIVVDTHVTRLSRRIGLSGEKTAEKIERELMEIFPQKEWVVLSHQLILLGRAFCMARKPKCPECPLNAICHRNGVEKGEM